MSLFNSEQGPEVLHLVRTVAGAVRVDSLGVVNSHDHLFLRTPALVGHELDDALAALNELRRFAGAGGGTVVQWTPRGMGRQRARLKQLSIATGVNIIAATGRHRQIHYSAENPLRTASPDALVEMFSADLSDDCGLIKVASGLWAIDDYEYASLVAAADAHELSGAPIAVHLEGGTAADLVLDALHELGVAPSSVVLGHLNRYPELAYIREIASSGAFVCLDGPSPSNHKTDWRTLELITSLIDAGFEDQLLLGGDTTMSDMCTANGGPGMPGLLNRTARRFAREVGDEAIHRILIENPRRAWANRQAPKVRAAEPDAVGVR